MRKRNLRWGGALTLLVALLVPIIIAGCAGAPGSQGPSGSQGPAGPAGPAGSAAAVPTFSLSLDPNEPGCGGVCHEVVAPYIQPNPLGQYTLAYEANHAWAGHGFDALGKLQTLNDCLACHAVGADGKGNAAPVSLRDIVHKVHLSSPHFEAAQLDPEVLEEGERPGDCFTCHVVTGS